MTLPMPALRVTKHAVERAMQRLGCGSEAEAICLLASKRVIAAANAGATAVILPSGRKIIIANNTVVTVKPKSSKKRRLRRSG